MLARSRSPLSSRALGLSGRALGVGDEPLVDGVADLPLERPERFLVGLALGELAFEVGAAVRGGWRSWQIAAMWMAWLSWRSPRSETLCTTRPPEENSTGAVPL